MALTARKYIVDDYIITDYFYAETAIGTVTTHAEHGTLAAHAQSAAIERH